MRRRTLIFLLLLAWQPLALASVRINIEGVEGDLRRNVLAFLSVERYKDRADLDEDTLVRLFNRIDGEVKSAVRPYGHYEPVVTSSYRRDEKDWHIDIRIDPGPRVRLNSVDITIEGPGADDPVFDGIRFQTVLRPGIPLNHVEYESVKGELTRVAEANGYLDARLLQSQLPVDLEAGTAGVVLRLSTGERYHFGAISINQSVVKPELMQRYLRFKEGDPYSTNELLRTQFALDDSLYFSTVEVSPGDRDTATLTVPVNITAAKGRRQLTYSAGYGTDTRVRGAVVWTDPRVNDRGHRFRAELKASSILQSIDLRYDVPIGDPALEKVSLQGLARNERTGDLDTNEVSLTPSMTRVTGLWQWVYSAALTHTETDDGVTRSTSNLIVPGIALAAVPKGYLGEALFTRGFYAELIGSHTALGSDSNFLQLHVQGERVFPLVPKWSLLLRGEVGVSMVDNFEDLPGIYRFFAGGDRSVRGFAYDSLSPEEPVTQPDGSIEMQKTGGRHLLVGSVEVIRELPRNLAVSAFFDGGNAFNKFGDPLAYSAGVGLRFRLPGVSLGIDVAQPLSESGNPRLHLNISPQL